MNILNIGKKKYNSDYINAKIKISNVIALYLIFAGLATASISLVYAPSLSIIPFAVVFIALACLMINKMGDTLLSRVILTILPLLSNVILIAFITPSNAQPTLGVYMYFLSLLAIVFTLFGFNEKKYQISIIITNTIIILLFRYLIKIFDSNIDSGIYIFLDNIYFEYSLVLLSIFFFCLSFLSLTLQNKKASYKQLKLTKEYSKTSKELSLSKTELSKTLNKVAENIKEENRRNQVTKDLAKISYMLHSSNEIDHLYNDLLIFIVKKTGVSLANFYIVGNDIEKATTIDLVSSYAYDRIKHKKTSILPGEGLIGQAYIERENIFINQVPEDYIHLKSGLGDSLPTVISIFPFLIKNKVQGILEIASYKQLDSFEVDFIERLGETVASSIESSIHVRQTTNLLEKSQKMTTQFKEKEINMREKIESLEKKHFNTKKNERIITGQLSAVDFICASAEFNIKGEFTNINDLFSDIMGYSKEEIIGRHQKILEMHDSIIEDEYNDFWDHLLSGKTLMKDFIYLDKNQTKTWLRGVYTPIISKGKFIEKIIFMAVDHTSHRLKEEELKSAFEELSFENNQTIQSLIKTQDTLKNTSKQLIEYEQLYTTLKKTFEKQEEEQETMIGNFNKKEMELLIKISFLENELQKYTKD